MCSIWRHGNSCPIPHTIAWWHLKAAVNQGCSNCCLDPQTFSHPDNATHFNMVRRQCAVEIRKFFFLIYLVLLNGVAISSLTFLAPVHKPPESESLLLWITMGALRSSLWSIRTLHSYLLYVAAIPNIYSVSSGNNFFGTLFALSSSHAHITPACPRCPTIPGPRSRMVLVFDKRRVKSGFNPCGYNSILRRTMDEREMRERTKWSFALELLLQWVCWVFTFRFPGILHQTYLDKD